jgi:glycosyltransferase involved in cell wall biosynthesis
MNRETSDTNPLVTAVVTTYDRAELSKRAINSVKEQTYEPLEVFVIEDGSDTGIQSWLDAKFPSVQYISHDINRGLAAARNTGLKQANGKFIAYLDDDDEWAPERIERQIKEFRNLSPEKRKKVGVVYCGTKRITRDGKVRGLQHPQNSGDLRKSIQKIGYSTPSSTFLFIRDALLYIGGFDESLPSSIDHDIWMALATSGYHAVTVDEPLVTIYETNYENMMTNTYPRIEGVKKHVNKWEPTFREWYGVEAGDRYSDRYFARVIAQLVKANIGDGDFTEAWDAIREIFEFSNQHRYNSIVVTYAIIRGMALLLLPQPVVSVLRQMKSSLSN